MVDTVFDICQELVGYHAGEDGDDAHFNTSLAELQDVLGQKTGDNASHFWCSEKVVAWNNGDEEERMIILSEYVAYEVRYGQEQAGLVS